MGSGCGGGGSGSVGDRAEASRRLAGPGGGGSNIGLIEQGGVASGQRSLRKPLDSRRDPRSSRRIAVGPGPTDAEEESFNRHFALETPLQQVSGLKGVATRRRLERRNSPQKKAVIKSDYFVVL